MPNKNRFAEKTLNISNHDEGKSLTVKPLSATEVPFGRQNSLGSKGTFSSKKKPLHSYKTRELNYERYVKIEKLLQKKTKPTKKLSPTVHDLSKLKIYNVTNIAKAISELSTMSLVDIERRKIEVIKIISMSDLIKNL